MPPPQTDHGSLPNLRFSFADAHRRIEPGGWAREVTVRELPVATSLAGVNMALDPGAVRELHWHKQAEWAYMLAGRARITALAADGRNFVDDVGEGDLWFFPPASRTRSRAWPMGASSCWSSTTAGSPRTPRSCSRTGSRTRPAR